MSDGGIRTLSFQTFGSFQTKYGFRFSFHSFCAFSISSVSIRKTSLMEESKSEGGDADQQSRLQLFESLRAARVQSSRDNLRADRKAENEERRKRMREQKWAAQHQEAVAAVAAAAAEESVLKRAALSATPSRSVSDVLEEIRHFDDYDGLKEQKAEYEKLIAKAVSEGNLTHAQTLNEELTAAMFEAAQERLAKVHEYQATAESAVKKIRTKPRWGYAVLVHCVVFAENLTDSHRKQIRRKTTERAQNHPIAPSATVPSNRPC
jgi:hypothetical protein